MGHKVDAARRCADLIAALARTANVRLALRETGISACWAYRRREADPDFAARWRTAVRGGRRAIAAARAKRARGPGVVAPAGLVTVGSSGKGTIRLERAKPCGFSEAKRAAFLDTLRATCNVTAAARAAGVSRTGAYRQYHADAALRADWEAALVEGRVHLEMALIGAARAVLEGGAEFVAGPVATEAPTITGMDAKVGLQVLKLHSPRDSSGRARGRWIKPADADETRAAILAKVAAVRAERGRGEGG